VCVCVCVWILQRGKVDGKLDCVTYQHIMFIRGREELCRGITRTKIKGKGRTSSTQVPSVQLQPYCHDDDVNSTRSVEGGNTSGIPHRVTPPKPATQSSRWLSAVLPESTDATTENNTPMIAMPSPPSWNGISNPSVVPWTTPFLRAPMYCDRTTTIEHKYSSDNVDACPPDQAPLLCSMTTTTGSHVPRSLHFQQDYHHNRSITSSEPAIQLLFVIDAAIGNISSCRNVLADRILELETMRESSTPPPTVPTELFHSHHQYRVDGDEEQQQQEWRELEVLPEETLLSEGTFDERTFHTVSYNSDDDVSITMTIE
jgi:hypothetical protein